jgi:hypothetical protein
MRPVKNVAFDSDALCDHYEHLRSYALKTYATPVQAYGLGVLLQKGMRAWIEATSDHFQVELFYSNIDSNEPLETLSHIQTQLAGIMAGIIIKRRIFNHGSDFKDNRKSS